MTIPFRLHHIGYLTEDLKASCKYFSSTFGYIVASDPIDDVGQTASVQFIKLPHACHYVELITPFGEASKLRNALLKGLALHHLAYEVPSVPAALAKLRENNCLPLGPPAPGAAFSGRPIAWAMDPLRGLVELVEAGPGARSLAALAASERKPEVA